MSVECCCRTGPTVSVAEMNNGQIGVIIDPESVYHEQVVQKFIWENTRMLISIGRAGGHHWSWTRTTKPPNFPIRILQRDELIKIRNNG